MNKPTEAHESAAAAADAARANWRQVFAQIRADHAARTRSLRQRHEHLLKFAGHPVLTALLEAHGPDRESDDPYPKCAACPEEYTGSDYEHPDWPCSVWEFISERMETP